MNKTSTLSCNILGLRHSTINPKQVSVSANSRLTAQNSYFASYIICFLFKAIPMTAFHAFQMQKTCTVILNER